MDTQDLVGRTVEIIEGNLTGLQGVVELNPLTSKTITVRLSMGRGAVREGDKVNLSPIAVKVV